MQTDSAVTTTEELLTAVADPKRRKILRYLRDTDEEVISVEELTDALAADRSAATDRDQLHISNQHVHLPKLADAGVVAFDPRSGTVRYTGGERVGALLEFVGEELEPTAADD
ncbi:ArsR/SmtB family transcription factor [Halosimplex halobium]|uniref:ArsR/SmtB family transcription factor n=1 Tax=Halosimplex halobium TaxID=3396618 RepID=UPI003F57E0FD